MKKIMALVFTACFLLTACNTATPENYFDQAVLNSNVLVGFAGNGMQRQLEQPSMKLAEGSTDKEVSMKRKEVIDNKIQFIENDLQKLKQLKETADTKDMLQTSVALHEYVLQVYKNEYQQLAKLYDDSASREQIQSMVQSIHDKYYAGFDALYNKLIGIGKPYAEMHHIKVNWGS